RFAARLQTLPELGEIGRPVFFADKNYHLIFASRQTLDFFPLPAEMLKPGTRLRDFLGAMYDTGIRQQYDVRQGGSLSREDWLSQKIASHWRERFD
ncbi:hypothetical protein AB9E28_34530, partial [Rhizobium leguminosarum]